MSRRVLGGALKQSKRPLRYVMGVLYVFAGVMHFVVPELYVQIVPPVLPGRLALVYVSGLAEVVLGIGLFFERTRRIAAWGIITLLVAIFPANVYMAVSGVVIEGVQFGSAVVDPSPAVRWGRLPIQAVLVAWAWWYTRSSQRPSSNG